LESRNEQQGIDYHNQNRKAEPLQELDEDTTVFPDRIGTVYNSPMNKVCLIIALLFDLK
jgi:hypothetical protein